MAVKPENAARTAINKKVPGDIHREKMGSPFSAGTADQWYSGDYDLWIEYKFLAKPPVRQFKLDLSTLQTMWLNGRHKEGRAVGVILCFPAKFGCWLFFNGEWNGMIDPKAQRMYSRAEAAAFITHGCKENALHSAIVRGSKSRACSVFDRDFLGRDLLHP